METVTVKQAEAMCAVLGQDRSPSAGRDWVLGSQRCAVYGN